MHLPGNRRPQRLPRNRRGPSDSTHRSPRHRSRRMPRSISQSRRRQPREGSPSLHMIRTSIQAADG